jgi:thiol-disulfide isomerase/thioredoxin
MFDGLQYYSAVWLLAGLAVAVGLALFWRKPRLPEVLAVAGLFAAIIGLYFYLRPTQTELAGEAAAVQAMIGQGTPVLLEFQSPYCVACIALKPAIDAIEAEFAGRLIVLRINVQEPVGVQLAPVYRFQFTPTFIFIDGGGVERWRTIGSFDEARLRQELSQP